MQISIRRVDNATILDVSGDIDLASSPEVRKALLHEVRDNRKPRVVMNLSAVRYIDSSGVASFGGRPQGFSRYRLTLHPGWIERSRPRGPSTLAPAEGLRNLRNGTGSTGGARLKHGARFPTRRQRNGRTRVHRFSRVARGARGPRHFHRAVSWQAAAVGTCCIASHGGRRSGAAHPFSDYVFHRLDSGASGRL